MPDWNSAAPCRIGGGQAHHHVQTEAPLADAATDEALVRRAHGGERAAFSELVLRYERAALAVARSVLPSWHDASDAVQDAFVTAHVQLDGLRNPRRFGGWLLRITRQQALLQRRRSAVRIRRTVSLHDERVPDAATTIASRHVEASALETFELLARLPAQECAVVSLRHLDELSVAEIARRTGRPVGTVTKQLSRAYARMRRWIGEAEVTHGPNPANA